MGVLLFLAFQFFNVSHAGPVRDCIQRAKISLKQTYEHLDDVFNKMESQAGFTACRATRPAMTMKEWAALKKQFWSNKKFRNTNPNGECNARATLISLELDRLGFKSEKIFIDGKSQKIMAPLKMNGGYIIYPYITHTANVVSILDDKGVPQQYVLDPMFTEDLVPLDDYVNRMSCSPDKLLWYNVLSQTTEPNWDSNIEVKSPICRYKNVVVQGSEKLVQINQTVERIAGGGRIYNLEMDQVLPVLGPDFQSAKDKFCSDQAGDSGDPED